MRALFPRPDEHTAVRTDLKAIFVSLELSHSTWVITSLAPGGGEKMSKHSVPSGDIAALLARLSQLKEKAHARDLEHVVTERCRVLNGDQLKPGTNFHWWPKPDIPA